jgi:pyruvate dehydrogenase E2 component (dihydrolipoamide acetyltransferase)
MADFVMPSLGADMESGKLLEWRIKPGDRVKRGDVVALVDTEKAAVEIEIFLDGVVDELVAQPGARVPVGGLLARVSAPGEERAPHPPAPRVSPAARRRATELGVDAGAVSGTGPEGAVTIADVERAAAGAAEAAPAPDRRERLRAAIAAAMSTSNREIPHYYLTTTIAMQRALEWLEQANAARSVEARLLPAALLVKATAVALREVPELNGFWRDGRLEKSAEVHVGVVVALRGGGVVVPAVHRADRLGIDDLMARMRDVVERARAGTLRSSELTDGTVTVTSLGDRGAECVLGVVFPPQVALVGFGSIVERPWVANGQLAVQRVVTASLAADHRASDGHTGARFLTALDERLQAPEALEGS